MLSLGITLIVSLAAAPATAAVSASGITCADEPASPAVSWAVLSGAADDDVEPPVYATPVEVECPTPAPGGPVADATCDETPPPDLWYRISTAGASENATSTIAASRRGHALRGTSAAGKSSPDTRPIAPPDAQPLALCAVPALLVSSFQSGLSVRSESPPARSLAPPDRPPRV